LKKGNIMESTEQVRLEFLLNGKKQSLFIDPTLSTLNLLKIHFHLMGTKEGCGEGDCGACTVALGELKDDSVVFSAVASCIYPAVKLHGKHLVTIEGLGSHSHLHLIQKHIVNSHGIQCGFCSPGIIMSFFALFAMNSHPKAEDVEIALQGNICRCTGYEGIKKAGDSLISHLATVPDAELADAIVPSYIATTIEDLKSIAVNEGIATYRIPHTLEEFKEATENEEPLLMAGGTDVRVQMKQHKIPSDRPIVDLSAIDELKKIALKDGMLCIGSQTTITECAKNQLIQQYVPELSDMARLMASTQIRNVATIAGNLANASPIGDATVLLLARNASLEILRHASKAVERVPLRSFFKAYRKTALEKNDLILEIEIPLQESEKSRTSVHFEKTSRRLDVDIATVNSASMMTFAGDQIISWVVAFGGVGPIPFTVEIVKKDKPLDKKLDDTKLAEIGRMVLAQCSVIDDVRGSTEYRKALVKNHIIKHYYTQTMPGQEG